MSESLDSPQGTLPLVSIILPVWNPQPDWLAAAIDSAFHESGCRIELVLVDDGSNEPPEAWLSDQDAARVHLIKISHGGVGRARNIALEQCHGEFIRFLDGDDIILPESTSMLLELAYNDPPVATYGSTVLCDPHLQPHGMIQSRLHGRIHYQTALGRFTCTMPALLIPRQAVIQSGGFDERLVVQGDWDFVLRVSEVVDFRGTQQPVYLYRRHESSLTSNTAARQKAIWTTELIIQGYFDRHPEIVGTRAGRQLQAYRHFQIAKLQNPRFPMGDARFWRGTAVDPVRGAVIAASRTVALGISAVRALASPAGRAADRQQEEKS